MTARDAPVGGQAVMEGVMMRGVRTWAVAVRRPDGDIAVRSSAFSSVLQRHRALRLPVVRGAVALVESMGTGLRALRLSAELSGHAPEGETAEVTRSQWAVAVAGGLGLAIGLFFLLPALLTSLAGDRLDDGLAFVLVEKLVRLTIFLAYLTAVSRLGHLQRLFAYHGAEHQTIAAYESGGPLTPDVAARQSRLHPRCGTSFLLLVMVVAVVVFAPLGKLPLGWLLLSRVLGIPLVAGLSFEAIKWMGRHRGSRAARALMWPGLQLQRLTTRPPDAEQLAVAIAALEAVLEREDPLAASEAERAGIEVAA